MATAFYSVKRSLKHLQHLREGRGGRRKQTAVGLFLGQPHLFTKYRITEADSLTWDLYADVQEKHFFLCLDFYPNGCQKETENIQLEVFVKMVLRPLLFNQQKG